MNRNVVSWAWIVLSAGAMACAGNDGTVTRDGSRGNGDARGLPDGFMQLSDGAIIGPDGAIFDPDAITFDMDGTLPGEDTGLPGDDTGMMGSDVVAGGDASDDAGPVGDGGCRTSEICGDRLDNNCDGRVDEGCACLPGMTQQCYDGPPAEAGRGVCTFGMQTCTGAGEFGTWGPCMGAGHPQPVRCGAMMDFRCNGVIDEGCACSAGATRPCYPGPAMTAGVGLCREGRQTCTMMTGGADWGPCMGAVVPSAELCDGMDRDCDGRANTGCVCVRGTSRSCYSGPAGTAGVGICRAGSQMCVAGAGGLGSMWGACMGEVLPAMDRCDGLDYSCRGMPGVGCACTLGATRPCYTGPAGTRSVGVCRDGTNTCVAMGTSAGWSATCTGQITPGAAEVCANGIDDNCNGAVDEGCGGMIMCPGDQTVLAGQAITLSVTGAGLTGYNWTIVSGPTGGAATAVWAPAPPTAPTERFTPYIVGAYVIRVTATDSGGRMVSCMFTVTALPHGLRVQLTWNGSGDLDLHVHNGTTTPWFAVNDCYYANLSPPWGAVLDFDNVTANGPENTRIDTPAIGMAYTIAVHNYSGGAGRIARIDIFCGSTMSVVPTATFSSRALAGATGGNCTSNDFWRVARVVMTSTTACTVTPINTYAASSGACTAF